MIRMTTGTITAKAMPAGATLSLRRVHTSSCLLFLKQLLDGLQLVTVATEGRQVSVLPRVTEHWEVGFREVLKHSRFTVGVGAGVI